MNQILTDEFSSTLDLMPDISQSVLELFNSAKQENENRYYLSIIDLERTEHDGKKYIGQDFFRNQIIQQFGEFVTHLYYEPEDIPDDVNKDFVKRLEMLAYSQFWECRGIQRLLLALIEIADDKDYVPELLVKNGRSTNSIYEEIISKTSKNNLSIGKVISSIYSNQIRNAFAHSEFLFLGEYITFENFDGTKNQIPSLDISTWDKLFSRVKDFILTLFNARRDALKELKERIPYQIVLDEFPKPFKLDKDDRGYWIMHD